MVYPGVAHMFYPPNGKELQRWPFLLAKQRTDDFLAKHLRPGAREQGRK